VVAQTPNAEGAVAGPFLQSSHRRLSSHRDTSSLPRRCPSCGYAICIETIADVQNKLDVEAELKLKKQEIEDLEKSIKSTVPTKKKEDV
jgi:hypothetical protein